MTKAVVLRSRLFWLIGTYSKRWTRLIKFWSSHKQFCLYQGNDGSRRYVRHLLFDYFLLISDLLCIPDVYNLLTDLFKKTRPLSTKEMSIGKEIFGNVPQLRLVLIDENARIGTARLSLAYVGFNTINTQRLMDMPLLIHELVHIWQYQRFGSIYIHHALHAQQSSEGYDYGGPETLYRKALNEENLLSFNFEQMAEIIEDYYKLKSNPAKILSQSYERYYSFFADQIS